MSFSRTQLKSARSTVVLTYAVALLVVAGLSITTHVILGIVISDQREVALIVNHTGRQRMLSQRIAWLAPQYAETGDPATRAILRETVTEMEDSARRLRAGEIKPGLTAPLPEGVRRIYHEEDVTRRVTAYLAHARAIMDTDFPVARRERVSGENLLHLDAIMAEASGPILNTLNNIVDEYVKDSNQRIDGLQKGQQLTLVIVILTLIGEAFFIFRPLASGIITYLERVKELSKRASAAQQANDAKSSFLAHMSHELRTPMTGIIGMSELLLNSAQSPEQERMTRMLRQSAQNLQKLLNDILDLAKIEAGSMALETVDFKLSEILAEVQNLFGPSMRAKKLKFTIDTTASRSDVFRGDANRLRQILSNLVNNALKFTAEGYVRVKFWDEPAGDGRIKLHFSVSDSGVGISEDRVRRLFQRFAQEDSSTARRFGGTGLGLAICKQLAEAMGGEIEVESVGGAGSIFTFFVFVDVGNVANILRDESASLIQAGRGLEAASLHVLMAEDNPTTQLLLSHVLSLWGVKTTIASNGREALECANVQPFDVILMDMQMPELTGDEAARLIRESGGVCAATPIIAVTADAIAENHERYLAAGCTAVVTKPISWTHLAQEIRAAIEPAKAAAYATA